MGDRERSPATAGPKDASSDSHEGRAHLSRAAKGKAFDHASGGFLVP